MTTHAPPVRHGGASYVATSIFSLVSLVFVSCVAAAFETQDTLFGV